MPIEWSREEVLGAVRTCLLRTGAVTDGYCAVDVIAEPDRMLVIFRWRRDPNTYAIGVEFPAVPESPWTGLPVASAYEWAADVAGRLAEDLATGLVRRSRRTIRDGYVLLDRHDAPDLCPAGFFIGSVPLDDGMLTLSGDDREEGRPLPRSPSAPVPPLASDAGFWLAEAGMDVTIPRELIVEGRLACWLQAYVDNSRGEPFVGQAATSWADERHTTVRLDLAHVQPGVPSEVREALVRHAVREAAEAGALRVITAIDVPELPGVGFRPANGGGLALRTRDTEPPTIVTQSFSQNSSHPET
ncbi:hypothetical protein [Nonomuraea cavernae]|uniref:hypothetical protein n=1 Tax=Nonomuraea cavernae TaxID=2045107 RepID=UPI001663C628|nr:hypothetical protein [Nonomuraea cavernae]MCA2189707.1 hypothetical protein [Nonomuraea cavernae]